MKTTFTCGFAVLIAASTICRGADRLPLMKLPPGKVVLVCQPHHDDHTTDYGMGGLIARFVDEGYDVYYVRASNDEKDGIREPGENDNINHRESVAATKLLGIKEVISLNWRNDYTASIPLNELRARVDISYPKSTSRTWCLDTTLGSTIKKILIIATSHARWPRRSG